MAKSVDGILIGSMNGREVRCVNRADRSSMRITDVPSTDQADARRQKIGIVTS